MVSVNSASADSPKIRLTPTLPSRVNTTGSNSSVFDGDSQLFPGMSESQQLTKLRAIAHNAPGLVFYLDRERRFQFINKQYQQWFGISKHELLGRSIEEVFTSSAVDDVQEFLDAALAGDNVSFESVTMLFSGDERWTMSTFVPDFAPDGEVRGVFSMVADITECRRAEQSLRESEERFRQLAEHIHEVFWVKTSNVDEFLYVSPAFERIWGLKCQDLLDDPNRWLRPVHPNDRELVAATFFQSTGRHESADIEYRLLRADGETRWIRDRGFPVFDDHGNVYRIVGIAEDITRQKDAEQALLRANEQLEERVLKRTQALADTNLELKHTIVNRDHAKRKLAGTERRFRLLFESSPDPIFIESRDGKVLDVNPAACELHRRTREELVGMSVLKLVPSRLRNQVAHEFPKFFAGKINSAEGISLSADGCEIPISLRARQIEFDGRPALLLHVRDVSAERRAKAILQRDRDQLERLVERRTAELSEKNADLKRHREKLRKLASDESIAEERARRRIATNLHDGVCQSLALAKIKLASMRKSLNEEQQQALDDIRGLLDHSIRDSRNLLSDLSPPVLYELGFEPAVRWLADHFHTQQSLHCKVHASDSDSPLNEQLGAFLFRAVRELLINIVKHSRTNQAKVSVFRRRGYIRVCVSDNGCGFTANSQTEFGSSGFGLYSIGDRLDLLGGRMFVQSRVGRGTKISLLAPLNRELR